MNPVLSFFFMGYETCTLCLCGRGMDYEGVVLSTAQWHGARTIWFRRVREDHETIMQLLFLPSDIRCVMSLYMHNISAFSPPRSHTNVCYLFQK